MHMKTAPATIVVIENHPMLRAALCAVIAGEADLTIAAIAANGEDVLLMIATLHPDVIMFSVGNPGLEDLSILAALHQAMPAVRILALISNEVPHQEQAVLESGAQAVLSKTAPRAELLCALREIGKSKITTIGTETIKREAAGVSAY